jgi:DNA invertase Pin-like site-specific DNA recombinase
MSNAPVKKVDNSTRTGRPRADVDIERILSLYLEDRMSVRKVARVMGISHTTVARRIVEEKGYLRAWRMPGET